MVKGSTYYAKLDAGVSLTGYSCSWKLVDKNFITVLNGSGFTGSTFFEVSFNTDSLGYGLYHLSVFATFPDSFIQNILSEEIKITA
jgi:hypothetical protein